MVGFNTIKPFPTVRTFSHTNESAFQLKAIGQIKHCGLNHYLKKRGIPERIGYKYLKELHVFNRETQKTIIALGLKNAEEGYELRNQILKSSIGAKSITFIRGNSAKPEGLNIFEGMFDFLSVATLTSDKPPINDTIILNSNSLIKKAIPYIQNQGYKIAYTWLDNDDSGIKATHYLSDFMKNKENIMHEEMNKLYKPFNDVNAWHMHKLSLSI